MGNFAQQIRRIVSSEKSHITYYSRNLCVRNLGIMSLCFTNTGPKPVLDEWGLLPLRAAWSQWAL